MKKLFSLLLCVFLLTAMLAACGDDTESKKKDEPSLEDIESSLSSQVDALNSLNSSLHTTAPSMHGHPAITAPTHNHPTTPAADDKVKYQLYTNADKTYRLVFRDTAGTVVAEFDKIPRQPFKEPINADKGIYELGWATGSGPSDFYCVYYSVKTGAVSQLFHAPRGTDGVRIAYGSEDQTKIIVKDVFPSGSYYKEHVLEGAYTGAEVIIRGGKLHADKKTVVISYVINEKGEQRHAAISLYD